MHTEELKTAQVSLATPIVTLIVVVYVYQLRNKL